MPVVYREDQWWYRQRINSDTELDINSKSQKPKCLGSMWHLRSKNLTNWIQPLILKNWCFQTVVLEMTTLESPLDCKKIKPVNPKGNLLWIFIGRTDAKAEAPILWPPDAKSWLIGKDPAVGKDWGQEKTPMPEDEMVGWHHHQLNGHEFVQTLGDSEGQGSL